MRAKPNTILKIESLEKFERMINRNFHPYDIKAASKYPE